MPQTANNQVDTTVFDCYRGFRPIGLQSTLDDHSSPGTLTSIRVRIRAEPGLYMDSESGRLPWHWDLLRMPQEVDS